MDRVRTILIVDDEIVVTRTLARMLAAPGRRILTTQLALEALAVVEQEAVDVVISDKDMLEMSGLELLRRIRALNPLIVRILLTGKPSLDSAMSAINAEGVFRYLTKPWHETDLATTVAEALERADELRLDHEVRAVAERRATAMAALAAIDPRLVAVEDGRYTIDDSPLGASIAAAVRRRQGEAAADVALDEDLFDACADRDPLALADALAGIPLVHAVVGAALAAGDDDDDAYHVTLEFGSVAVPLVEVPAAVGRAAAGRLACLARIDLGRAGEQFGRIQVRSAGRDADVMLGYAPTPRGPAVELRRLVTSAEDPSQRDRDDLLGRYRILDRLGEGATAVVYRALHLGLERQVALKVLRSTEASDPRSVARFLREARVSARVRHPNIVEVLDYGQLPDGRPFLAMELLTCPTLDARLAAGPLSVEDAVAIARQLAAGLGSAHAAGVIHRDLKPANVFIGDDLRVRIGDFGAAKLMGGPALTQDGWTVGTPLYMAPEQITVAPTDHRLDLYALGCILHHMLSGRPPYEAATVRELLVRHLSAPLPELRREVPAALARVVHHALAKSPDERPQSAAAFEAELVEAMRPGLLDGLRRWIPRNPLSGD